MKNIKREEYRNKKKKPRENGETCKRVVKNKTN